MEQRVKLTSEEQTIALAQVLAPNLTGGSTVLLNGIVGAGKTHFARHVILSRLAAIGKFEDVPSPTFTLVQTYDLDEIEIWHADLYRLSDVSEVYELGLEAAFDTEICLIEWPDRLGELTPKNALSISLDVIDDDARLATLQWTSNAWEPIVKQVLQAVDNDKS